MKTDKRIDVYIENAKDFAKPVLNKIRNSVHKNCPEIEETIKWSFPHFMYKGSILCSMASFNSYCAFGFRKASLISELKKVLEKTGDSAMGQFGKIRSVKDLPSDKMFGIYFKRAMEVSNKKIKKTTPTKPRIEKKLLIPDYFLKVLKENISALKTFEGFTYSHKKEYLDWITGAKLEVTREKRINSTINLLMKGKSHFRN